MEIIGIDAGASWIKAGRFSSDRTLLQAVKVASGARAGQEPYLASIRQAYRQLTDPIALLTRPQGYLAVGLGLPGMFSKDGQHVLYLANVRDLGVTSAGLSVSEIRQWLGIEKLVAGNDAKYAALAEWQQGAGHADPNLRLLHLTWGTGLGTGLIEGGRIAYGWEGGHIPFEQESELEIRVGVRRLAAQAKVTAQRLRAAAMAGDPQASAIITEAVHWLARGLRTMAVIGYPDLITIGGAFPNQWLVDQLRDVIARSNNQFVGRALTADMIHLAQLGNQAGMIGAAIAATA